MRKYQPVWEQLKLQGKAALSAEPETHTRIIHAVRKEKCMDLGWKLQLEESGTARVYKLEHTIQGSLLTFILVDVTPAYKNL